MEALIAAVLARLRVDILRSNLKANVEGLLARHVLLDDARLEFDWAVDCDATWLANSYDPRSLPSVAALGFSISHRADEAMLEGLADGMRRAAGRDAASASRNVALHSPAVLIGLVLGAVRLKERSPQYLSWCCEVIQALKSVSDGLAGGLVGYAASLAGKDLAISVNAANASAAELAAADWRLSQPGATHLPPEKRKEIKLALVQQSLREETGNRAAHEAALIWRSLHLAISESTSDLLKSPATVVHMLEQFESCMRRWRWDGSALKTPIRWPMVSEREVQDVLYLMLRAVFLDLEDEDTLPKFGHSTYRADFGIPSLGLLVEAKFARSAADFKEIEKEVLEDIVPYLQVPERYNQIVVFIYDHSASVQVHETTARALRRAPGIAGVVIASRPSHLPAEQLVAGAASASASKSPTAAASRTARRKTPKS